MAWMVSVLISHTEGFFHGVQNSVEPFGCFNVDRIQPDASVRRRLRALQSKGGQLVG